MSGDSRVALTDGPRAAVTMRRVDRDSLPRVSGGPLEEMNMSGERLDSEWVRSWCEQTSAALEALRTSFAERHGFPPGENSVLLATDESSKATDALVDHTPIPSDLTTLYWVISEVSMADVDCGYFIHSPATVAAHFREYGSVRLDDEMPALVFASDGGGHLFAVAGSAAYGGRPRLRGSTTSGPWPPAFRSSSSNSTKRSRTRIDHGAGG
ncbi:hypothetical protein AB0K47_13575 [Streptomyces tirandamycinicus]|uniref:hypothetical protein n=1 Tax=Streptomyces tirandamycinicus TaxID=2174846 RepID=UPI00343A8F9E